MKSFIPKNKFEKLVHLVGFILRIKDLNFIYWFNNPHIKTVGLKLTDTETRLLKNVTEKCVPANSFVKLTKNFGLVFIPNNRPDFKQHHHMSAIQRLNYWAESLVGSTEPANQGKGRTCLTNRDKRENKWTKRTLEKKKGREECSFIFSSCLSFNSIAGSKCLKHPVHQNGNWMKCVGPISLFEGVLTSVTL